MSVSPFPTGLQCLWSLLTLFIRKVLSKQKPHFQNPYSFMRIH